MLDALLALAGGIAILALLIGGCVAIWCWADRTGRPAGLWLLGAYAAANVVWALLRARIMP